MLYDQNSVRLLLGCLLIKPSLAISDKYHLSRDDFTVDFHLRLWQGCVALAKRGAESISALDLYMLCKNNKQVNDLFKENDLSGFIDTIKQLSNIDNYSMYYDAVRKMSLLRAYQSSGFNVDKFEKEPEKYTIKEIIDYYDGLFIHVKKEFYKDQSIVEAKAGDGLMEIKEMYKAEPSYGATTFSEYLNTAARGWQKGQIILHGAVSGSGKTALGLYNLALIACPELWDDKKNCYKPNPYYQHEACLYIQYELHLKRELSPKLVASVSGVGTYHFLDGKYIGDEEERVDRAIEIIQQSQIYLVSMPSFTTEKLKSTIKDYMLNKQVKYVIFDYVSKTSSVSSEVAKRNNIATRGDEVLAEIVSTLKDIAVENNIAVLTFSQTNANINTQEILDAGCLAGSRAMQDKLDVGSIIGKFRKNEQEVCDMMMEKHYPNSPIKPNRILHLFKARFGNTEQNMKIWGYLDLNTGRFTDMWCTDVYNKPINVTKTRLVYTK